VAHLKQTLQDRYGILGFAGAPFTLFAYCVEGVGSDDFREARTLMHRDPQLAQRALNTIADIVADLLLAQVDAGADAVQLFDSWGGLLAPDEYRRFALPALQCITAKLNARKVPTLLFVRGGHHLLPLLGESGVTGFSLETSTRCCCSAAPTSSVSARASFWKP
jgi:uroporphyrinogen decarboxylase